jgi:SAM-dependent methyltransferase
MKCLLCGSNDSKFLFNYKGRDLYLEKLKPVNFRLSWYACRNCGVFFSRQHRDIEKVYEDGRLYDAQYDEKGIKQRFQKIMRLRGYESDNSRRVKRIKSFHKRYISESGIRKAKFRVLDIGAGLGVFLAKFLDNTYDGYALEVNKVAARHIRRELKIPVYRALVQDFKINRKFDLITLNKVIEHIKKPLGVLRAIKDMLSENGLSYLELPDTRSYESGGSASDAFASGHYMVYNPASVAYLVNKAGYEVLNINRIFEPSGKHTIYAFLRSS